MDMVKRFKSLVPCIGLTILAVMILTTYGVGVYTAFYEALSDVSTLLDVTKWQHLSYG